MKWNLRRYGWLYLTLMVLVAWPVVLWRAQAVPPLHVPSLQAISQAIQDEFIEQHPDWKPVRMLDDAAVIKLPQENTTGSAAISRLTGMGGAVYGASILKPELELFANRYEGALSRRDEQVRQGLMGFPAAMGSPDKPQSIRQIASLPNTSNALDLGKARRAQAESHFGANWPEALRLIESAAAMDDPIAYSSLIGNMVAMHTRVNGYHGYGAMLHAGPPPDVLRAALESLARLRRRDVLNDKWAWMAERQKSLQVLIYTLTRPADAPPDPNIMEIPDIAAQRNTLFYMAGSLAGQAEKIQDPGLKKQAISILRDTGRTPVYDARNRIVGYTFIDHGRGIGADARLKWTTAPAMRKWMREMLEREPWVIEDALGWVSPARRETLRKSLEPWTLMMGGVLVITPQVVGLQVAGTRAQVAKVKGRLMEAAFAARVVKEETGAWPQTIDELAGRFPQLREPLSTSTLAAYSAFTTATLPRLGIAGCKMTNDLRAALWYDVLPLSPLKLPSGHEPVMPLLGYPGEENAIQLDGTLDFVASAGSDWVREPVRMLAIQQALLAHPELVESAQVLITSDPANSYMKRRERDEFTWWPLTPSYARALTDGLTREQMGPLKEELDGLKPLAPPGKSVGRASELPDAVTLSAVRLKAKLRAPEKVIVIWSPGPDDVDSGGAYSYDLPGAGTRGDLLVFPEEF